MGGGAEAPAGKPITTVPVKRQRTFEDSRGPARLELGAGQDGALKADEADEGQCGSVKAGGENVLVQE